jgi:hypothetical protein
MLEAGTEFLLVAGAAYFAAVLVCGKRLSGGCAGVDELSLAKRIQSVRERVLS